MSSRRNGRTFGSALCRGNFETERGGPSIHLLNEIYKSIGLDTFPQAL